MIWYSSKIFPCVFYKIGLKRIWQRASWLNCTCCLPELTAICYYTQWPTEVDNCGYLSYTSLYNHFVTAAAISTIIRFLPIQLEELTTMAAGDTLGFLSNVGVDWCSCRRFTWVLNLNNFRTWLLQLSKLYFLVSLLRL